MKKHFSISSRLSAVYRGLSALKPGTSCSSYFMKTSPAKTHFQMCPFPANTRSEKSRTPPDRSATPYYVESFQFQPGSMEQKIKIWKVLSKTLLWSKFSGLTAWARGLGPGPWPRAFQKSEVSVFRMRHYVFCLWKSEVSAFRMRHLSDLPFSKVSVLLFGWDI